MAHLSDESIYRLTFERGALDAEESSHLASCPDCQARAVASSDLAQALAVARFSEPTVAQRSRLLALKNQVQTSRTGQRLADWIRAQLAMDTRAGLAAGGVRGMGVTYRLLYSAQALDVELMVEPANGTRTIRGALLPVTESDEQQTTLVQLEAGGRTLFEAETTLGGRFTFEAATPGTYRLWIVRADSADVLIENLEIS